MERLYAWPGIVDRLEPDYQAIAASPAVGDEGPDLAHPAEFITSAY